MGEQGARRLSYYRLEAHGDALGPAQAQCNDDVRETQPLTAVTIPVHGATKYEQSPNSSVTQLTYLKYV